MEPFANASFAGRVILVFRSEATRAGFLPHEFHRLKELPGSCQGFREIGGPRRFRHRVREISGELQTAIPGIPLGRETDEEGR